MPYHQRIRRRAPIAETPPNGGHNLPKKNRLIGSPCEVLESRTPWLDPQTAAGRRWLACPAALTGRVGYWASRARDRAGPDGPERRRSGRGRCAYDVFRGSSIGNGFFQRCFPYPSSLLLLLIKVFIEERRRRRERASMRLFPLFPLFPRLNAPRYIEKRQTGDSCYSTALDPREGRPNEKPFMYM